jgi:hypothetical protein
MNTSILNIARVELHFDYIAEDHDVVVDNDDLEQYYY